MLDKTKNTLLLIGLCISFFMVIADVTAVNVALPNILSTLQTSISGLQWVVAGYALTFAGLLLLSGHLADLLGAKQVLLTGLILFIVTSLACALAPNIEWLIAFRLLQGIAGATLVPCSLALINATYRDNPKEKAKKIGVWASIGGVAAIAGPVFGGLLTALFSWRAVFFINLPFGLLAMTLIYQYSQKNKPQSVRYFDILGQLFAIISIASLTLTLIEAGSLGWLSPFVLSGIIIFIVSSATFVYIEKKVQQPMLPLKFFKINRFSVAVIIGMALNLGVYGELFILPIYFQHIRGYSIMETGFALLPLVSLIALSSYLSGKLVSHKGAKLPLLVGCFIGTLGFFSLLIIQAQTPAYYWLIIPLSAIGFGLSFCQPAATLTAIQALPQERAGMAAAIFTTSRQIGSLIGVALFGSIIATTSHFIMSLHITFIIAGSLFLCAFLLSLIALPANEKT